MLGQVGLGDVAARKVKTYSQGMRQRLGMAAAMLGRPPLLILDEPANGLDPAGIREIRGLLRGLAAEGTTVFLSSHLLAEVEQVCDRVAVIVRGRLVEEGAPVTLGAIRRQVRVEVGAADTEAATRLLARWPAGSGWAVPGRARQRPGRERCAGGRRSGRRVGDRRAAAGWRTGSLRSRGRGVHMRWLLAAELRKLIRPLVWGTGLAIIGFCLLITWGGRITPAPRWSVRGFPTSARRP